MQHRYLLCSLLSSVLISNESQAANKLVVVQYGESIGTIAKQYNVPPKEIVHANNIKPPYQIFIGQSLVVPMPSKQRIKQPFHPPTALGKSKKNLPHSHEKIVSTSTKKNQPPQIKNSYASPVKEATLSSTANKPAIKTQKQDVQDVQQEQQKQFMQNARTFIWPVRGTIISNFGKKENGLRNDGINIQADKGTPVVAIASGTVVHSSNEIRGFGNLILLKHDNGWMTAYAHTDQVNVQKGQKVNQGEVLAVVGVSGHVSSPQLHFELRQHGKTVDPLKHLPSDQ